MTAFVGLIFGIPAARVKGLYLGNSNFSSTIYYGGFFSRAAWFTGGVDGASAEPFQLF